VRNEVIYNTIDELGLIDLFNSIDDFYMMDIVDQLTVFKKTKTAILETQEIFEDFLYDKEDYLEKVEDQFSSLQKATINYQGDNNNYIKMNCFVVYIYQYLKTMECVKNSLARINIKSKYLSDLYQNSIKFINSKLYNDMKTENITAYEAMERTLEVYYYKGKTGGLSKTKTNTYNDLLREIGEKLKIQIDNRITPNRHVSVFNDLRGLSNLFDEETNLIKTFYNKYKTLTFIDFNEYQNKFKHYLLLKRFYRYLKKANIPITKAIINEERIIDIRGMYDITLINREFEIIPNDFKVDKDSCFRILTGTNGGGKTSYIRAIGLNIVFFHATGFVFADYANLPLIDDIHTLFSLKKEQDLSKFKHDLKQMELISKKSKTNSMLLLNEVFSGSSDELIISKTASVLDELIESKKFVVFVTHSKAISNYVKNKNLPI